MPTTLFTSLIPQLHAGSYKALARCISLVENEVEGYADFLKALPSSNTPIIGITGPPGAGKSTLVDALVGEWVKQEKKLAVLCIDPSSPFNLGALLGDRIRMSDWYNHPNVFIRSLATRGSLGGLHPNIIEVTDVIKAAQFDYMIVETVGVGQSEIEIAGLADVTVVVMVPEAGDEIQTMKAGLMEIANIFVVNKSDRPEAENFAHYLRMLEQGNKEEPTPVLKTIASQKKGIPELSETINTQLQKAKDPERKYWLLAEKAWHLLQKKRMNPITKRQIKQQVQQEMEQGNFNMYRLIETL